MLFRLVFIDVGVEWLPFPEWNMTMSDTFDLVIYSLLQPRGYKRPNVQSDFD